MAVMTADQLQSALVRDGHPITDELFERAVDALAGPPGGDGLPKLDVLPVGLQEAMLTELYRDFFAQTLAAAQQPMQ